MDSSSIVTGDMSAQAIPFIFFATSLLLSHISRKTNRSREKHDKDTVSIFGEEEHKIDSRTVNTGNAGDTPPSPSHSRTTTDKRNIIRNPAANGRPSFLTPNKIEKEKMAPIINKIQQSFSQDDMSSDGSIHPLVLGIAGGTASGKTTLSQAIYKAIGPEAITFITHDCYYKDLSHLSLKEREVANFDHPESLDTPLLIQHIKKLKSLKPVRLPTYDYSTHSRLPGLQEALPRHIILVEGILIFDDPELLCKWSLFKENYSTDGCTNLLYKSFVIYVSKLVNRKSVHC